MSEVEPRLEPICNGFMLCELFAIVRGHGVYPMSQWFQQVENRTGNLVSALVTYLADQG